MKHAILLFAAAVLAPAAPPFVPLFDGKTLAGWEICDGSAKFAVEDGVIVGTTVKGSPNTFLCTKKEYGDFVLEFEVKNDPVLNTGVQLRSHKYARETETWVENKGLRKRTFPAGRVHGYQLEISNEESGNSGGIFDEARRGWIGSASPKAHKDNQWNKYRVEAAGDSIKTWVNGVPAANLVDSMDLTGFIALQVHAFPGEKPAQVRWRNLRIQDLGRHAWQPVWDGKTLNGWKKWGGGEWTIENGGLRGVQTPASADRGFLLSEKEYGDFTARLLYKVEKGNSGFFFRMSDPASGPVYEIEIDPTRDPGGFLEPRGRMWIKKIDPKDAERIYRPNDWNELIVSAHGRRIVIHVNGIKTVDLPDDPGPQRGRLALQLNPKQDLTVWFKDISVLAPVK